MLPGTKDGMPLLVLRPGHPAPTSWGCRGFVVILRAKLNVSCFVIKTKQKKILIGSFELRRSKTTFDVHKEKVEEQFILSVKQK